ncbi:MAG TPA: DUF4157 domain-containing protein [Allosphingosinicella sp.]|nr:DUF4157 domain-containing protein [Allosphingosinicella sp.]
MPRSWRGILQRKCACGGHTPGGGACRSCGAGKADAAVPTAVRQVLSAPGRPLDPGTRGFMEPRFGQDFSGVRVHDGATAASAARSIRAQAFTAGRDIVFDRGRYAPGTDAGRHLLAHELTHVVQQRFASAADPATRLGVGDDPALEREADQVAARVGSARAAGAISRGPVQPARLAIARASEDATGYVMRLGQAARTGLQFFPTDVKDTMVGQVFSRGGMLSSGASRLSVILGENMTMNRLAAQLLPLWTTATPVTPPGAAAPLPLEIITADELARALMAYNDAYLPVPDMTNWRAGLRLPLPVDIDENSRIGTVNPAQIKALATGFLPAWADWLERPVAAAAAPNPALAMVAAATFLGSVTTTLARGIQLGARAVTNAVAERAFVQDVFRQLGPAGFDVALTFMDFLSDHEVGLLASQADGAAILATITAALATMPPNASQDVRDRVDRADLVLAVAGAMFPPRAAPAAARTKAEKRITVDTVKLAGSTHDPANDVRMADSIFSQCNVRVVHGVNEKADLAQTTGWLGGNTDIRSTNNCNGPSVEERAMFNGATSTFKFNARFKAHFAATATGVSASGYSCPTGAMVWRNRVIVLNSGDSATLAHELGHILINLEHHTKTGLMSPRPARPAMRSPEVTDPHCNNLYRNA